MIISPFHGGIVRQALRVTLLLGAVFGFTVYAAHDVAPGAAVPAVINLPSQVHDFGPIMPFSKSETSFSVKNTSSDTLYIDRLIRSCGCTAAETDRSVVPPGQTFLVKAILSTRADVLGVSSHITLYGHCGNKQVTGDYQLLGNVQNVIEFLDEGGGSLRLGSWTTDQLPRQVTVTVKRASYPLKFDGLRISCDSPILSATVSPLTGDTWQVVFRLNSNNQIGTFGYPVTFGFTEQGKVLPQTVPQQAYVEMIGPFTASPCSLLINPSPGDRVHQVIAIAPRSQNADTDFPRIISVSSSSSCMKATASGDPDHPAISLDYSAPMAVGNDSGQIIVILSDHGKRYTLRVGFLAMIS